MSKIHSIQALEDNYIWLIQLDERRAAVIDPGESAPVVHRLNQLGLELDAILITHKCWDHVGGTQALSQQYKAPVYGPANEPIPHRTDPLSEGQLIQLGEVSLQVMEVPGHTSGHIAFYGNGWLFSGDTLFGAGCGRLHDGTMEQLFHSLTRLKALPPATLNYCAHEYTIANLNFALQVEPDNLATRQRMSETQAIRKRGLPSLPSTLAVELQTNPFLRCHMPQVIESVEKHTRQPLQSEFEVFRALRLWKNNVA